MITLRNLLLVFSVLAGVSCLQAMESNEEIACVAVAEASSELSIAPGGAVAAGEAIPFPKLVQMPDDWREMKEARRRERATKRSALDAEFVQSAQDLGPALQEDEAEPDEPTDAEEARVAKEEWIKENGYLISEAGLCYALDKLLTQDEKLRAKYPDALVARIRAQRDSFFGPADQNPDDWGPEVWRTWKRKKAKAFARKLLGEVIFKRQKRSKKDIKEDCKAELIRLLDEMARQERPNTGLLSRLFNRATVGVAENWRVFLGVACVLLVGQLGKTVSPEGAALSRLQGQIDGKSTIDWGYVMRLAGVQDMWVDIKRASTNAWKSLLGE